MESPKKRKKRLDEALRKSIAGLNAGSASASPGNYTEEDPETTEEDTDDESIDDEDQDDDFDEEDPDTQQPEEEEDDDDDDNPDIDQEEPESEEEPEPEEEPDAEPEAEPEPEPEEESGAEEEKPGETREELEEPENPVQEPGADTGAEGGAEAGAEAGAETAAEGAAEAGLEAGAEAGAEAASTAGAAGSAAGAGAGASGAAAGAGAAAGGSAAAAGGAAAGGAAAGAAATGAAASAGAAAAGGAAAAEGAVVAGATIELWGPIVLIVIGVVAIIATIAIGYGYFKKKAGGIEGATPPISVDADDAITREAISELAALAGDSNSRRQIATKAISGLGELLDRAERDAERSPFKDEIINAINLVRAAAEEIEVGRADSSSTGETLEASIDALFTNLDKIIALYYGINVDSAQDIADRALTTVDEAGEWVFTTNNVTTPENPQLLRNGRNEIDGKRGCDAAGFGSLVLTRDPTPDTLDQKLCVTCVTPGYSQFSTFYSPVLATQELGDAPDVADLVPGDIVLTSQARDDKTFRDLFVVVGNAEAETPREMAHCSAEAPFGPQKVSVDYITQNRLNIDKVLSYKYARP